MGSRRKSVHELLPGSSKAETGQTCMGELPARSSESHHIHCCESQSRVLTDGCRSFPCLLPCQGSEACASEIASGRLLRKGQRENSDCRREACTVPGRLARASGKWGLRAGAQFKKPVPQPEKENFGRDTRRRLCGDRIDGDLLELKKQPKSVSKASIIGAGSTKSIKALNRRI